MYVKLLQEATSSKAHYSRREALGGSHKDNFDESVGFLSGIFSPDRDDF
jgi:hypothetical protein